MGRNLVTVIWSIMIICMLITLDKTVISDNNLQMEA